MPSGPSSRILRLLSLLQTHRFWSGAELAERLQVSQRTLRRDIDRLRELGYNVDASRGVDGGYRLEAGADMPPLLLDDEEAVAIAIGLRAATGGGIGGVEETSVRALAKLEQVLPPRLRRRVQALQAYTVPLYPPGGPTVDPGALSTIASACRDRVRLRFTYRRRDGEESERLVEPERLVSAGRRWYLVAWDVGRRDWRTFRVDRLEGAREDGARFEPRVLPAADAASFVAEAIAAAPSRHRATVTVHAPADEVEDHGAHRLGVVEAIDDRTCRIHAGSDAPEWLAVLLALLPFDTEVEGDPEVVAELDAMSARLGRSTRRELAGER